MRTLQVSETPDQITATVMDSRILDALQIKNLGLDLKQVLEASSGKNKPVVIDLGRVQFMSSAMISTLVNVNKSASELDIVLRFAHARPNVREVFRITGIERGFRFDDDGED